MSEPYGAFVRLRITRANLVQWLDAPPSDPARWTDWRRIGGRWYIDGPMDEFAKVDDRGMAAINRDARARTARWGSVREALPGLIRGGSSGAFEARRITYDPVRCEFDAGSLFFDEGLIPFLAFLALVRGSEDFLGTDGSGIAVIHDYAFAPAEDEATVAALTLGPGKSSRLMSEGERSSAVGAFQEVADVMLADPGKLPPPVDQLGEIR